jgi:hypothetical protein
MTSVLRYLIPVLIVAGPAHAEPVVSGYVQADAIVWSDDSVDGVNPANGAVLNDERFLIRRARLHAEYTHDAITGALELDGNTSGGSPTAKLLSAQLTYTFKRDRLKVAASAGLFKTPFGAEVPASDRDKPFLESPAFARALFPGNYDAGAMVRGSYGPARWSLAIVNGAPVSDTQWHGKDPLQSYDFVGRLGAIVSGPARSSFEVGVSGSSGTGYHAGRAATDDDLKWVDANGDGMVQSTELVGIPGMPAQPGATFHRNAVGADAQVHWCLCTVGTGLAFAELAYAKNLDRGIVYADPIAASRNLHHLGFAVGLVQNLGAHASAGVRYDRYDADRDESDNVFSTLSVMATARLHDARLLLQYDHEREPASQTANAVTVRAQVGF